jgi:hypothetical protein
MSTQDFAKAIAANPSTERAKKLVEIYNSTPGSTGPYCCVEALAAVLDHISLSPDLYKAVVSGQLSYELNPPNSRTV